MDNTYNYHFFYKGPLTQWFKSPFTVEGVTYGCAEQYMMHQKALLFGDTETAEKIMATQSPKEQQDLGRVVKNYKQSVWDANKLRIVYKGNYEKFSQNPELKKVLFETGHSILVEASPIDTVWGIGMAEGDVGIDNPENWKGQNLLGWLVQLVRNQLMSKENARN